MRRHEVTRRRWPETLAAFAALAAVSVLVTWPLARFAATRVPQGLADPVEVAWIVGWVSYALVHQPTAIFHANLFWPEPYGLAYAENLIGMSVPAAPVFWLTGNALLASNVAILLAYTLAGFTMYLLVREITGHGWLALAAGIAYGIAPYRVAAIGHPHVVAVYTPVVLLFCLRLARGRSPKWSATGLALAVAYQMWTSLTGWFMTMFAVGAWGAFELLFRRPRRWRALGTAAAAVTVGVVLAGPVIVGYAGLRARHPEYTHRIEDAITFSATTRSYLYATENGPVFDPVYRALGTAFRDTWGFWEKPLFPGVVLLVAFLLALARGGSKAAGEWWRTGRLPPWVRPAGLMLAVGLVAFAFSLGPKWFGDQGGFLLPFELLRRLVPGSAVRVPARIGELTAMAMAGFAAVVAATLAPGWRRAVVGVALVGLVLEGLPGPVPNAAPPPITAAHRALASGEGPVLALPTIVTAGAPPGHDFTPDSFGVEALHLYFSTAHFRPLVNGYGSYWPRDYVRLADTLQTFPDVTSIRALRDRGVATVVVETRLAAGTPWESAAPQLDAWPGVRLVAAATGVRVYDLRRAEVA